MRSMLVVFLVLAVVALAGCVSAPIISNPAEGPKDPAEGSVKALTELLEHKDRAVVIFIHGVGDHCPGFALGKAKGSWLNDDAQKALGLVPRDSGATYTDVFDDEFIPGHPRDVASKVTVGKRRFSFPASKPEAEQLPVDAIEITWSQLTQWVKTNQLGYDLTEPSPPPDTRTPSCPYPQDLEKYKKPPARVSLNRLLKEQVLDRSLADAVLYAGTYGRIMRRGTAEALCIASGGTPNPGGHLCDWPKVPEGEQGKRTAYFFVTHSLGSRLIYDTLLGLTGKDVTTSAETFSRCEVEDAKPFANYLMAETGATYMMANQLTMLGLAYEDGTQTSSGGPVPYDLIMQRRVLPEGLADAPPLKTLQPTAVPSPPATPGPKTVVKTAALEFAVRRQDAADARHERVNPLTIVAFSDTNDLLSWAVPKWYQGQTKDEVEKTAAKSKNEGNDKPGHAVDFTNVFVQNATRWFGFVENPADAHSGYFTSADVWRVIRCGAAGGKVKPCE